MPGRDGNLTLVSAPSKPLAFSAFGLIMGRRSLSGSNIGGIGETQEMLDFCGAHNITADVEVIPIQKVNTHQTQQSPQGHLSLALTHSLPQEGKQFERFCGRGSREGQHRTFSTSALQAGTNRSGAASAV